MAGTTTDIPELHPAERALAGLEEEAMRVSIGSAMRLWNGRYLSCHVRGGAFVYYLRIRDGYLTREQAIDVIANKNVSRCKRCRETVASLIAGGICVSCADDLRQERLAEEMDPDRPTEARE